MTKIFVSCLFFCSLLFVVANNDICKNKPKGFECGINRSCFDSKCVHKELLPINLNDIFLAISLIFGSATSIICGIGGTYKKYLILINMLQEEWYILHS